MTIEHLVLFKLIEQLWFTNIVVNILNTNLNVKQIFLFLIIQRSIAWYCLLVQ